VEAIARQYERAGMACVSVVTGQWFGGSPLLLEQVSKAISLPLLHKDFIISPSAIERSKKLGAAAVLLTRKLIGADMCNKLIKHSLSLGLTPFVEVCSESEISELMPDSKIILAINNRDINVKETDQGGIERSLDLLPAAMVCGAGAVVSASGIKDVHEAKCLLEAGFDGLLIGTTFLKADDLGEILEAFRLSLSGIH
jgi:indole-3-glycerol phosphate synthase